MVVHYISLSTYVTLATANILPVEQLILQHQSVYMALPIGPSCACIIFGAFAGKLFQPGEMVTETVPLR